MTYCLCVTLSEFSNLKCHIESIMRRINLGCNKFDVTEVAKWSARHCCTVRPQRVELLHAEPRRLCRGLLQTPELTHTQSVSCCFGVRERSVTDGAELLPSVSLPCFFFPLLLFGDSQNFSHFIRSCTRGGKRLAAQTTDAAHSLATVSTCADTRLWRSMA